MNQKTIRRRNRSRNLVGKGDRGSSPPTESGDHSIDSGVVLN